MTAEYVVSQDLLADFAKDEATKYERHGAANNGGRMGDETD